MTFKTILMMSCVAMVSSISAMTLADASAKIDAAIADSSVLTTTMQALAPADQVSYLARVNEAIQSMPGSPTERAANFLKANRAAMKGAAKGNLTALLAETFATVPPEALTVVNERFAKELFNRAANPERTILDDEMTAIAVAVMKKIQARTAKSDYAAVRDTFAVLMFIHASNGTPSSLRDSLLALYPDADVREMAQKKWIPAALGENQAKTYDPLLGACNNDNALDQEMVLMVAGPQSTLGLLAELNASADQKGATVSAAVFNKAFNAIPNLMGEGTGLDRVPRTPYVDLKYHGGWKRPYPKGKGPKEPKGYRYQDID